MNPESWLKNYPKAKFSIKLITKAGKIYQHGFINYLTAKQICDKLNNKKGRDEFLIRYEIEEMR